MSLHLRETVVATREGSADNGVKGDQFTTLDSPVHGAEVMLQALAELDRFISQYPNPLDEGHWDYDARHTRIWLESNRGEIQVALEKKLSLEEYSIADIDEQIRLLFESLELVPAIRQADENYSNRAEHPAPLVPERIALNRARHELLRNVAIGLGQPLVDSDGNPTPYITHDDVESVTNRLPIDPARARIHPDHAQLIDQAYRAMLDNQKVTDTWGDKDKKSGKILPNPWFKRWVDAHHKDADLSDHRTYGRLFSEWFESPDYPSTRAEILLPIHTARRALGLPRIMQVPAASRNQVNQRVVAELQADLASDDLRYEHTREQIGEADRTTSELLRQIKVMGVSSSPTELLVQATVFKANQTAIDVIAGFLYLQKSGKSSMSREELAEQLDAFARTGAFMYAVELRPLPPHDRAKDVENAQAYNEALRSFMLADAIARVAVLASDIDQPSAATPENTVELAS